MNFNSEFIVEATKQICIVKKGICNDGTDRNMINRPQAYFSNMVKFIKCEKYLC